VLFRSGKLQLWNINSMCCIYEFPKSFGSPITFIAQSPVVDVIAIGTLDGTISIHNIKLDKELMSFQAEGKVTAISFRTDDHHMMATANMTGDVFIWNLDTKSLFHTIKGAHDGTIMSAHFLNGQPILITGGSDNSVKQWIFDAIEGLPRLLKFRSGHHAPPTYLRHYGEDGNSLLSVGSDRSLRSFSIIRDSQNVELSQGSIKKSKQKHATSIDILKLPPILNFGFATIKERDWDNIITCHSHDSQAKTWSYSRKAIGKHTFKSPDSSSIKSVAVSTCGNFAFVATVHGNIAQYNMQSGIFRQQFNGHTKTITGVVTDNLSQRLFSSSLDGTVKTWNISTGKLLNSFSIATPISQILLHQDSGLLAVSSDDLCIRILDTDTYKVVRELIGHRNRILDMCFSFDSRWVISTSLDSTIRTWDLPTGNLIDCFRADTVATSVSFSPTGDFLATCHVDHVGIFLWANKTQFTNVSLKPIDDSAILDVNLPSVGGIDVDEINEEVASMEQEYSFMSSEFSNPSDLVDEMISLSNVPKSRWQNLLNLESIKKRNKPKDLPKAPELAPFFLPTIAGPVPKFVVESEQAEIKSVSTKVLRMNDMDIITEFTKLLRASHELGDYSSFFAFIKELSPSALDFELQSMSITDEFADYRYFIEALRSQLLLRRDFELVEAYLSAFLKINGEIIIENAESSSTCQKGLGDFLADHLTSWKKIDSLLQVGICLTDFVRQKNA